MAMVCLEEPLCPNSPQFKPYRFLIHSGLTPVSLPPHAHPWEQPLSCNQNEQSDGVDAVRRSKRSILAFLNNKARRSGDEKNQLK